jgi:hypothetical protein
MANIIVRDGNDPLIVPVLLLHLAPSLDIPISAEPSLIDRAEIRAAELVIPESRGCTHAGSS